MALKFDYHMHTKLSDGGNSHEEMVLSAIEKGFDEIGFSDHFGIKQPCNWAVGSDGISNLEAKVRDVQLKYDGKINVLFGVECDYFSDLENEIGKTLKKHPFDYITGSVHFLGDWNYDSSPSGYENYTVDYVYEWYFGELQKAAKSGLFDIMAHPDLIKKFKYWPEKPPISLFRETAKIFAEAGVAFEVNTSGIDRPCGEFFPGTEFLSELFMANVPVTLGSDSHKKEQIGRYFDEAKALLKNIGYKSLVGFKQRRAFSHPI